MAKPIGILGGTFDPVHHGHLRLALEIYQRLALGEVRLVPLFIPPHRNPPVASPQQRAAMVRLAIDGVDGLVVDECEIKRGGISYTLDTLINLREGLTEQPLCLIIGMDAFQQINTWHRWRELLAYAHLLVVDRPGGHDGFKQREVEELFAKYSTENYSALEERVSGSIIKMNTSLLDISSTQIRELIAQEKDPHYLLPNQVIEYIQQHKLYR